MKAMIVIEKLHWTYEQYMNTPAEFIEKIMTKRDEEGRIQAKRSKQNQ